MIEDQRSNMTVEQRLHALEGTCDRLRIEVWVLRQIVQQQVHLINKKGIFDFDQVLKKLAESIEKKESLTKEDKDVIETYLQYQTKKD
ncbi:MULTISPECIES: hypothetical protein [unclassified Citrobacter]|uniref:hypothetical protein n=1 Tax=unclassified Citrobacter TaxID=2644389 RepID=UPI002577B5D9|nr:MULTISPECIES: hypothetical protein [unclassified Citrobacter]MDM3007541.1 hypothetical protein [Citrobacter sp. CK191]MDM3132366.1 hypothetical protein [Citrobacter sp. CK205]